MRASICVPSLVEKRYLSISLDKELISIFEFYRFIDAFEDGHNTYQMCRDDLFFMHNHFSKRKNRMVLTSIGYSIVAGVLVAYIVMLIILWKFWKDIPLLKDSFWFVFIVLALGIGVVVLLIAQVIHRFSTPENPHSVSAIKRKIDSFNHKFVATTKKIKLKYEPQTQILTIRYFVPANTPMGRIEHSEKDQFKNNSEDYDSIFNTEMNTLIVYSIIFLIF